MFTRDYETNVVDVPVVEESACLGKRSVNDYYNLEFLGAIGSS